MEAHRIEDLAKGIAVPSQGRNPLDILSDEDTVEMEKALAGMRIRAIECPKTMTRAATDAACNQLEKKGGAPCDDSVQIGEGRLFRRSRYSGRN